MNTGQTGPRTPEGKKRSSLNALKHGLTAQSPHAMQEIGSQCQVSFMDLYEEMVGHYEPRDPVEQQLVMRIARCAWRLSLSAAMEQRVMDNHPNPHRPSTSYDRILKFERLVDIHLHRAIATLHQKREMDRQKNNSQNETRPPFRLSVG